MNGLFSDSKKLFSFLFLFLVVLILTVTLVFMQHKQTYDEHASTNQISYSVVGKQIIDNNGRIFIPYGVQLNGISLAETNWQTNSAVNLTENEVAAASSYWYSNTVSLQIASAPLLAVSPYDQNYLARIDQVVNWSTQRNMNIILVLQYESTSKQILPTQDSINFWNIIAPHYANNHRVFFDIFNEPADPPGVTSTTGWDLWQNGGTINGITYLGMQQLVNTIRNNNITNLIFVDGMAKGEDLQGLPTHLLTGTNLIYAVHPYFSAAQHGTSQQWDKWFGNIAVSGNFPVTADEWSEYADGNHAECYATASAQVIPFFGYLTQRNIGIIGYALFPGTLIRGWNYKNPTLFDQKTYTCPTYPFPNLDPTTQGAGGKLRYYIKNHSGM